MKYALFLGCSIPARGRNYALATRKVAQRLGIELIDVEGFTCCGFPAKSVDWETYLLMAAGNLGMAERAGLDICTVCNGGTLALTEVNKLLREDSGLRKEVNRKLSGLGRSYEGNVKVKHFARILYEDVGLERIKASVKRSLKGLKIAAHYGCHYLRPSDIYEGFDDPRHPRSLDELIEATGAESIEYEEKDLCCGFPILGVSESIALTLANRKLSHIKAAGADAICLICPFGGMMYDGNQEKIERKFDVIYNLPVLYYPQLLGLAMGFEPEELGLQMNRVKADKLIEKIT